MTVATALKASRAAQTRIRLTGGDTTGLRQADDFYPTPPEATEALLRAESFDGPIWEPACGDGAISKVLEAAGHRVVSTDLVERGYGQSGVDFLMEWQSRAPNIITNPPYKLAVPFLRHSLAMTTGKVAMLLRLTFLESKLRAEYLPTTPFARVHVFGQRITFKHPDARDTHGGGMMCFAWFVWDHAHTGKPTLGWL
jgi:hypothetical protein